MPKMSSMLLLSLSLAASAAHANAQQTLEPTNLGAAKQQLNTYYQADDQGNSAYEHDTDQVVAAAKAYLAKRIQEASSAERAKMAIVFDIDDTLIWRYPYNKSIDFSYHPAEFEQHQIDVIDPLVPHIKSLYDYALAQRVAIFIITAGCEHVIKAEMSNLRQQGLTGWQAIYAKPDAVCHDHALTSKAFKTAKRQAITEQGYDIVLSIGDQTTDLGQYADKGFKLPNPMYVVN